MHVWIGGWFGLSLFTVVVVKAFSAALLYYTRAGEISCTSTVVMHLHLNVLNKDYLKTEQSFKANAWYFSGVCCLVDDFQTRGH